MGWKLWQTQVDFKFKGELEASSLKPFFDHAYLNDASGTLFGRCFAHGRYRKTGSKNCTAGKYWWLRGDARCFAQHALSQYFARKTWTATFSLPTMAWPWAMCAAHWAKAIFCWTGFQKHSIVFDFRWPTHFGIETDLKSNLLDLDELLLLAFSQKRATRLTNLICRNLYLNFDCRINRFELSKIQRYRCWWQLGGEGTKATRTDGIKLKPWAGHCQSLGCWMHGRSNKINLTHYQSFHPPTRQSILCSAKSWQGPAR